MGSERASPDQDSDPSPKLTSFEDLLELCGTKGWRNVVIFFICSVSALIPPMHLFTYQFLGSTPGHWCQIDGLDRFNLTLEQVQQIAIPYTAKDGYSSCTKYNISYDAVLTEGDTSFQQIYDKTQEFRSDENAVECRRRFFNSTLESVVTKWDLVCERRAIYSTTQAAVHAGMLIGSLICGYAIDRFGRAFMYKGMVVAYLVIGFATCFSFHIAMFILLKVFVSIVGTGFYMAGFVILMEISSLSQRTMSGNYFVLPWALGIMLAVFISYFVRSWRYLQAALTVPCLLLLSAFWLLPESPRWLVQEGRYEEAYDVLHGIAASNNKQLPPKDYIISSMQTIRNHNNKPKEIKTESEPCRSKFLNVILMMVSLVLNSKLRLITLAMFFCWFSVSLVYYGVSLGSTALSTDPYLYIFLGGILELISYLLLWPLVAAMGRKRTVVMFFFVCAFSILSVMIMVITVEKEHYSGLKTTLFLAGKFAATAAFHLLWVFTAELYPTNVRSLAIGECSTIARVGSICSPYVNDLLGAVTPWAPAALFASLSMVAGAIGCILPDTSGVKLADSLEEKSQKEEMVSAENPTFEKEED